MLLAPLLMSGGAALLGGLLGRPRKSAAPQVQFPEFDTRMLTQNLFQGIGEDVTRTGRSAQKMLSAQGMAGSDTGMGLQKGIAEAGFGAFQQGLGGIEQLKNQAAQQRAMLQLQQARYSDRFAMQQPSALDILGLGVKTFGSLFPLMNPDLYMNRPADSE